MSLLIARIKGDTAERIGAMVEQLDRRRALYADLGTRMERLVQDNFSDLDKASSNKLGGTRTHFWDELRSATSSKFSDRNAEVNVAHPAILQKLYGGTIKADDRKLALPATAEAYSARTPRSMDLRLSFRGRDLPVLVDTEDRVQFWLKDEVTQQPTPETIPSEDAMNREMDKGLKEFGERITRRGGGLRS